MLSASPSLPIALPLSHHAVVAHKYVCYSEVVLHGVKIFVVATHHLVRCWSWRCVAYIMILLLFFFVATLAFLVWQSQEDSFLFTLGTLHHHHHHHIVRMHSLYTVFIALFLVMAGGVRASSETLPSVEAILGQRFEVSVLTSSFGTFNATLAMRGSITFAERLHGELVPHGAARIEAGQTALPHFGRTREVLDDHMSSIFSKEAHVSSGHDEVLRPSLFALDVQLRHPDAPQGVVELFFLPAELDALQHTREAMSEGSVEATATAKFHLRPSPRLHINPSFSDKAALAREAHGELLSATKESTASFYTLELLSEHEWSLSLSLSMNGKEETVWVHGYTSPDGVLVQRASTEVALWQKVALGVLMVVSIAMQVVSGFTSGRKQRKPQQAAAIAAKKKD